MKWKFLSRRVELASFGDVPPKWAELASRALIYSEPGVIQSGSEAEAKHITPTSGRNKKYKDNIARRYVPETRLKQKDDGNSAGQAFNVASSVLQQPHANAAFPTCLPTDTRISRRPRRPLAGGVSSSSVACTDVTRRRKNIQFSRAHIQSISSSGTSSRILRLGVLVTYDQT